MIISELRPIFTIVKASHAALQPYLYTKTNPYKNLHRIYLMLTLSQCHSRLRYDHRTRTAILFPSQHRRRQEKQYHSCYVSGILLLFFFYLCRCRIGVTSYRFQCFQRISGIFTIIAWHTSYLLRLKLQKQKTRHKNAVLK